MNNYPKEKKWWIFEHNFPITIERLADEYILYPNPKDQGFWYSPEEKEAYLYDLAIAALRTRQRELYPDS